MLLPVLPLGPNATGPAGKVFVKTSNERGVDSSLRICVPVSVQVESIHERRPIRVSTATAAVAECVALPATPVAVMVKLPEAPDGIGTVSTELLPAAAGLALNDGVEPEG